MADAKAAFPSFRRRCSHHKRASKQHLRSERTRTRTNYPEIPDSSNRRQAARFPRRPALQSRRHPLRRLPRQLQARHPIPHLGHLNPPRQPHQGLCPQRPAHPAARRLGAPAGHRPARRHAHHRKPRHHRRSRRPRRHPGLRPQLEAPACLRRGKPFRAFPRPYPPQIHFALPIPQGRCGPQASPQDDRRRHQPLRPRARRPI